MADFLAFLAAVFSTDGFGPLTAQPGWTSTQVTASTAADLLRAACCVGMTWFLIAFVRRRRDAPLRWMFYAFSLFLACNAVTHLVHAATLFWPVQRADTVWRCVSAAIGFATILAVVPRYGTMILLPNADELAREIQAREATERQLRHALRDLQNQVHISNLYRQESEIVRRMASAKTHRDVETAVDRLEALLQDVRRQLPAEFAPPSPASAETVTAAAV